MSPTIENEKQNRMFCLDVQIIREDKTFTTSVNLSLVEFIHFLTAFYHLHINLLQFTHSLIDASEYAEVGLKCTLS